MANYNPVKQRKYGRWRQQPHEEQEREERALAEQQKLVDEWIAEERRCGRDPLAPRRQITSTKER